MRFISSLITTTVAASLGSLAQAGVTFSQGGTTVTNQGQQSSFVGATSVDFNDRSITSTSTTYTFGLITLTGITGSNGAIINPSSGSFVSGDSAGNYSAPGGDTSVYLAIGGTGRPGPVTATFSTAVSYFGFSWTSPDTFNSVQLFNGSTSLGTFVPGTNTPGLTVASTTGYANFVTDSGDVITRAVFTSPNPAFETDNFAYSVVPEPSTYGLLLLALCGAGFMAYRKRLQVA